MTDRLTRRILGPLGDDPGCEGTLVRLDELVEVELNRASPGGPLAEAARHLEACPDCREDFEGLREIVRSGVRAS